MRSEQKTKHHKTQPLWPELVAHSASESASRGPRRTSDALIQLWHDKGVEGRRERV